MKIRPKTFELLKELLLEKGGVFYKKNMIIYFDYIENSFLSKGGNYEIQNNEDMKLWLKYDDWYIKV